MQVFEINILRKSGDNLPVVVELSQPDLFLPVRIEDLSLEPRRVMEFQGEIQRSSPMS